MPLREAPLTVRCHRCDAIADSACQRCDRPACDEHAPGRGRRCDACEAELERRLAAIPPVEIDRGSRKLALATIAASTAFFALAAAIAVIAGDASLLTVAINAVAGALFAAAAVALASMPGLGRATTRALRRRRARRRFLAERPGQRRLGR